jgi:hypothetical protein
VSWLRTLCVSNISSSERDYFSLNHSIFVISAIRVDWGLEVTDYDEDIFNVITLAFRLRKVNWNTILIAWFLWCMVEKYI